MIRRMWTAAAIACAATASLAAQHDSTVDGKTVTVVGCVQNYSTANSSARAERGFLLSNATRSDLTAPPSMTPPGSTEGPIGAPAPATSVTAAGGTVPMAAPTGVTAGASARSKSSFVLNGHDTELKETVGKKIEVKGTIEPAKQATPRLEVTSLKVIASDCSSK